MPKSYFFTYNGRENITLEDFINPSNRLFFQEIPVNRFLRFDGGTGMNNADRIYAVYNDVEKALYQGQLAFFDLPFIKPGTDLVLPTDEITIEYLTLYGDNQFLTQTDFNAYWSENLTNLMSDPNYVALEKVTNFEARVDTQLIEEKIRVYVWISAVNQIYDISPFVMRMSTAKNMEVGSFSLTLTETLSIGGETEPVNDTLGNFIETNRDIINVFPVNRAEAFTFFSERFFIGNNQGFFETFLQYNDLVFLRYETLALETRRTEARRETMISNTMLPGQVWDMIGLIDTVRVSRVEENVEKIVQVTGRDLMKLLIDDASYFIPTIFSTGSDLSFIYAGNPEEDYFKRNIISGAYEYYFNYAVKSIRDSMGFIINHLANLRIVNDELFDTYGDRVTQRFTVTGADRNYIETKDVRGIWKIVKLFIDPVTDNRRIADDSLAKPDGSLLNYVKRICQEPFVEFWGDTNGDTFDFTIRQAPLTGAAIRRVIGGGNASTTEEPNDASYITLFEKDITGYTLDWETRYYSWYQIQAQNTFLGNSDTDSLSIIPIIFLPQYVNKFGNKRLILTDNYIFKGTLKGNKNEQSLKLNTFIENILNDLKYIIDINSYLPFTRRGTITLVGDRRIKVGTFVRLDPTNELYYVTAVNNSVVFSNNIVERVTTLTVERGMKFAYINGISLPVGDFEPVSGFTAIGTSLTGGLTGIVRPNIKYSYFNIVNTNLIIRSIIRNIEQGPTAVRTSAGQFGVNDEIFRFFAERQQMRQFT